MSYSEHEARASFGNRFTWSGVDLVHQGFFVFCFLVFGFFFFLAAPVAYGSFWAGHQIQAAAVTYTTAATTLDP